MEIPFSRWYPAIEKRRSRRHFNPSRPIEPLKLAALETLCKSFTPFPYARCYLVAEPVKGIFKGIIGGYGEVKGAPAFVAFVGDMNSPFVQEAVGYNGEGFVLEATALGLNTCWVAGFFRPESVASRIGVGPNERVLAVTPLGYANEFESLEEKLMTGFGKTHVRLPISKLVNNWSEKILPDWINACIGAARLAPSAINRQPWGFSIQNDGITIYVRTSSPDFNVSKRLDCGIAMLHMEVAAGSLGIKGEWESLKSPQVAKFRVRS